MWRVQRRAFADEQRRRDHWHERLRLACHESGHAIANLAHGAGVERISIDGPPPGGNPNSAGYCTGRTAHIGVWARLVCSLADEAADEVFFTRPHGEWTDDRIDAWLIARDIDRDHVTETTAKAWSAAGELVVQHRQALERLALHLVDAGEMSGAEVDAVLGDLRPPQGIATKREHAFTPWDAPIIADLVRQDGSVGG
jgi:hypothetical protein